MPSTDWMRATTSLPRSSTVSASARTITSYGPVTSSASVTPGADRTSDATAAALPTSVWIRTYACTMDPASSAWTSAHATARATADATPDDGGMPMPAFLDRRDAGDALADALGGVIDPPAAVLGIPRGGVVVAARVAARLALPLGVVVTKKLGAPHNPELGIGAVAPGVRVLEPDVVSALSVGDRWLARESARVETEVARRAEAYGASVDVRAMTAVVVDDGVATGSTARAAGLWARHAGARRVVLAVPVAPMGVERRVGDAFDEVVAVLTPSDLRAVGQYYADFRQVGDAEVRELLRAPTS